MSFEAKETPSFLLQDSPIVHVETREHGSWHNAEQILIRKLLHNASWDFSLPNSCGHSFSLLAAYGSPLSNRLVKAAPTTLSPSYQLIPQIPLGSPSRNRKSEAPNGGIFEAQLVSHVRVGKLIYKNGLATHEAATYKNGIRVGNKVQWLLFNPILTVGSLYHPCEKYGKVSSFSFLQKARVFLKEN